MMSQFDSLTQQKIIHFFVVVVVGLVFYQFSRLKQIAAWSMPAQLKVGKEKQQQNITLAHLTLRSFA